MVSDANPAQMAFKYQEISFSICMAAVAILGRGNPEYATTPLLSAFAALLAFNLLYQIALRRRGDVWYVPLISMAVNTVLVTAVLHYSGGENSGFWPMYLLPIFTACLYLQPRHVVMAAVFSSAFLGSLHLSPADGGSAGLTAAELLVKIIVLAMSAGVTSRFARRERSAREALELTRADLNALASDVERMETSRYDGTDGATAFMQGIIYDVHARLNVILGSVAVLRRELGPSSELDGDAERIEASARSLGELTADVLRLSRRTAESAPECRLERLTEQVLGLLAPNARERELAIESRIAPDLPVARGSSPHVQQALLELATIVVNRAKRGSRLSVQLQVEEGEIRARFKFAAPDESTPPPLAAQRKALAAFGGDVRTFGAGRGSELLICLPTASPRDARTAS